MEKETITLRSIGPDKLTSLEISGLFYQRLNKLLINFADSQGKEGLISAMIKIRKGQSQKDDFAYNLETILILLRAVEDAFERDGHIGKDTIEITIPSEVKEEILKG